MKITELIKGVDRFDTFTRDNGMCHICQEPVDPNDWHMDYVIPLAHGGTHDPDNVAVFHPKCNRQKYTNILEAQT